MDQTWKYESGLDLFNPDKHTDWPRKQVSDTLDYELRQYHQYTKTLLWKVAQFTYGRLKYGT